MNRYIAVTKQKNLHCWEFEVILLWWKPKFLKRLGSARVPTGKATSFSFSQLSLSKEYDLNF